MMSHGAPTDLESHFAFGKNWASYATLIGQREIEEAKKGLLRLVAEEQLLGRSFLDIGCGSGLHSLAAAQLGVSNVVATDIDPDSVATTTSLLGHYKLETPWRTETRSVFDLDSAQIGRFGIVYSWGVLHHTGDMWGAVEAAASHVEPGGLFAFALYRSTRLDAFWKREKEWYAHASHRRQRTARGLYILAHRLRSAGTDNRPARGMDYDHDVHDWLGGYPYETAGALDVETKMTGLGFRLERAFTKPRTFGLFGSGCNEYVYRSVV